MSAPLLAIVCLSAVTAALVAFRIFHAMRRRLAAADQQIAQLRTEVRRSQCLEQRMRKFEEHIELAKNSAGLSLWEFVPHDQSVANWRRVPDDVLWSEAGDSSAWPTLAQVLAQCGASPADQEQYIRNAQACVDGKTRELEVEFPVILPDGSASTWWLVRGTVSRNADGTPSRLGGVSIDITARKRVEEQMRKLAEGIEHALRGSETAIWDLELYGDSITQSRLLEYNVWGAHWRNETLADREYGAIVQHLIPPEHQAPLTQAINDCLRGEREELRFEYQSNGFDGGPPRWRFARGRAIRSPEGKPLRFVGTSVDITALKQAEEDRQRATSLLELATKLSRVYVWQFNFAGDRLEDAQATFINVWESLGYDPPTAPGEFGSAFSLVVLPEDHGPVMKAMEACIRGQTPGFEAEYRVRHKDGSIRWNFARGIVTRDPSGNPLSLVGTSIDVTALKAAEEDAGRHKERLELSILGSNACTWDFELVDGSILNGRATYTNVFEILGYTPEDDTSRFPDAMAALIRPEDQAQFVADVQKHLDGTRREWEHVHRVQYKDGSERWHLARGVTQRDPTTKRALRLTGISIDITERKALEEDLQKAKDQLELGMRGSSTAIYDIAMPSGSLDDATITVLNGWEQYGYDPATAPTHFPSAAAIWIHPEDQARAIHDAKIYLGGGAPRYESEYRVRHADGSVSWTLARGGALRDAQGKPTRFLGSLVDITAIKRIEGELQHARQAAESANRAKDEFLANVSHEIRTPMNAILGMTELALDASETAHQRQLLSTVKMAARDLLHVINDLLDFSKITAGKLALEHADFSLRAAIGDAVRALAVRAHRKGLELICDVRHDVPDAYHGDAGRLRQVLMNLIGNAIKFTARGEVVVEVMLDPGAASPDDAAVSLLFTVRDTGIGIAAEKHAAIFRAFEQEDASTTRKFGGTGLGLTISAQLAALMGGRITVDSEPGRGSTFGFTARFARSSKPDCAGLLSPAPLEDVDVLVVDDNETNRQILMEWLTDWRMRPTAAADATSMFEALEHGQESGTPYSLILLDGRMPDVDGITLATQIRERFGPTAHRLILLSSDDSPALASRSRDAGIHARLLKPVQQSELLETIWAVMNTPADVNEGSIRSITTEAPPETTSRSHALHILVAEDNELNVTVLRALLGQRGHSVELAGDGRAALELATRDAATHDLMLLDLHMPEMDGFEVVRGIREHERGTDRHLAIIALTARSSTRDRERALAAGMDDFLSKPIEVEALWSAIDRVSARLPPVERQPSRLLDPRAILRMCGGRAAVLEKLCDVFRRSLPEHMTRTRAALDDRDLSRLREAAHMLYGTLSPFSTVAGALASTLEDAAMRDDGESCSELVPRLEAMCNELLQDTRGLTLESLDL